MNVKIGETRIDDTFAEAFGMKYARVIVTAADQFWLDAGIREFCGFSASVIACDLEMGLESYLTPEQTPDGRVGATVMAFGFSAESVGKAVSVRVGQCLMTCASTAVFDGLPESDKRMPLGKHLRFFGDGFQKSKLLNNRRYWRIPVMDGEFLVEDTLGIAKGIAGGNIIIQGTTAQAVRNATRNAVTAVANIPGIITPFPGGVARSGSKVGSRYPGLKASTSDAFCPTLKGRVVTRLHPGVNAALEIVLDGKDAQAIRQAMLKAATAAAGEGIVAISAGNYGGKLGPYHFPLQEILAGHAPSE